MLPRREGDGRKSFVILSRLQFDAVDKTPEESLIFLDRPAVPDLLKASELAPQFCSESVRIGALQPGRRRSLSERFLESCCLA